MPVSWAAKNQPGSSARGHRVVGSEEGDLVEPAVAQRGVAVAAPDARSVGLAASTTAATATAASAETATTAPTRAARGTPAPAATRGRRLAADQRKDLAARREQEDDAEGRDRQRQHGAGHATIAAPRPATAAMRSARSGPLRGGALSAAPYAPSDRHDGDRANDRRRGQRHQRANEARRPAPRSRSDRSICRATARAASRSRSPTCAAATLGSSAAPRATTPRHGCDGDAEPHDGRPPRGTCQQRAESRAARRDAERDPGDRARAIARLPRGRA